MGKGSVRWSGARCEVAVVRGGMLGTANCAGGISGAGWFRTGAASCELLGLLGSVKDVFVVICRELARGTVGFSLSNQERCSSRLFEVIWLRCRTHGVCLHPYVF